MRLEYHPKASAELNAAVDWYEERGAGLGADLQDSIERNIDTVLRMPSSSPLWPGVDAPVPVRRKIVGQFPYALAYFVRDNAMLIVAVAHTSRLPGYWLDRVS